MVGGADVKERKALLKEAQARAAQAQAMLEEALRDQVYAMTAGTEEMPRPDAEPEAGSAEGDRDQPGAG
jgi:hypothetical protein